MGLIVKHLVCTNMRPLGGRIVNESGSLLRGRLVCHVFLIETEAGLVLVDSGLAVRDLERPATRMGHEFAPAHGARTA